MAFPVQGEQFPSIDWAPAFEQWDSNNAWFSGDQVEIQRVTAGYGQGGGRGDNEATHYNKSDRTLRRGGVRGFLSNFFNGRLVTGGPEGNSHRTRIHAPVAGNIATLSADLLTAEPAVYRFVQSGDGETSGDTISGPLQQRLDKIMNGEDTHRTMSQGAELAAGLGGTVLTANWDKNVADEPWLDVIPCDAAIPEFIGRRLVAVNLYTQHDSTAGGLVDAYYVHIERHEPGFIIHGLIKASLDGQLLGMVPLDTIAATEHIPNIPGSLVGDVEQTVKLPTGISALTAQWWRNLPTKTFRRRGVLSMMGRADFEGGEQLLDAIDEVWSSWMRDIKIARARLIVPETFLDVQGPGLGGAFDTDAEILTALAFTDLDGDGGKISAQQFEIRATEHSATLHALTKEITQKAGYSLSSYSEQEGGSGTTATEVTDRTTLTERTRDKKFLYQKQATKPLAIALMELDAVHFNGTKIPADAELSIEIPALSQIDPEKEARIFQYLRSAMAVSTDTLVRRQNPDWEESQIEREVIRIQAENNLTSEPDAGAPSSDPNVPQEDPTNPGFDMEGKPMPAPVEPAVDPEAVPA